MSNLSGLPSEPVAAPELVQFFKALSDPTRLTIAGLLAREALTGEQLAMMLKIKPATVSHHLAKLVHTGLVEAEGHRGREKPYRLRLDAFQAMAQRLLTQEALEGATVGVDVAAFDRKVIKDFVRRDGSLKQIPAQLKKLQAVLRYAAQEFKPGRDYSEKQVNDILSRFHADTASLRRHLISERLLLRDSAGKKYWLAEKPGREP